MDSIEIVGGNKIQGDIYIAGSKNAALPLIIASLLTKENLILQNIPNLTDIKTLMKLLEQMGCSVTSQQSSSNKVCQKTSLTLSTPETVTTTAPYALVRQMRASVLTLGPLVARFGHAKVSLPGGCAIGTRPVDLHIKALEKMGATIVLEEGYIIAKAPANGLKGAQITFPMISVGATENTLMAATLAKGTTIINNAACEPEIDDLCYCLQSMGAKITGIGTHCLQIEGVSSLGGATYTVMPDRIEAGSYAIAAILTRGKVTLHNITVQHMSAIIEAFQEGGVGVKVGLNTLEIYCEDNIKAMNIKTQAYPGFPTDMQAQFMALLTQAHGLSTITENVFENRFMHVPELSRMGANILCQGRSAVIKGVSALKGAQIMATDLRASMSLVLAALVADGVTTINRVYHIDRGYEHIIAKLSSCGADIKRVPAPSKLC